MHRTLHFFAWVLLSCLLLYVSLLVPTVFAHKINPAIIEKLTGEKISYASTHDVPKEEAIDPRTENRTFYSFPEWYIVYSAQEYGDFIERGGKPSAFPFFEAITQMWQSWKLSEAAARSEADSTTNTVLWTIAISFSFEYGTIGLYEKTIGSLTEALSFGYETKEDVFINNVAIAYGDSLNQTPWYDFPYGQTLKDLWRTYGWSSLTPRGIERRIAYSFGYGLKALYANAIRTASDSGFGEANLVTKVVATDPLTQPQFSELSPISNEDGTYTITLPRYRAFLPQAMSLAEQGVTFVSIQDNTVIALSVMAPTDNACLEQSGEIAFSMPIATQQSFERYVLTVPVRDLASVLRSVKECGLRVEHIYDY